MNTTRSRRLTALAISLVLLAPFAAPANAADPKASPSPTPTVDPNKPASDQSGPTILAPIPGMSSAGSPSITLGLSTLAYARAWRALGRMAYLRLCVGRLRCVRLRRSGGGEERDATNADHRSIVRFAIALVCVTVVMLAGGCQLFQGQIAPERRPTVVGIIAERDVTQTNDLIVTLVDGRRVTLPVNSETLTAASSAGPDNLLLADPTAAKPWFVSLTRQAECFFLGTPYAEIRQNVLVMANGLIVPLAPDFVAGPGGDDGRFEAPVGAEVCLDDRGQAVRAN